ncbi:MAG: hypothetical protein RL291_413 [Pseudomonadota bacterium]
MGSGHHQSSRFVTPVDALLAEAQALADALTRTGDRQCLLSRTQQGVRVTVCELPPGTGPKPVRTLTRLVPWPEIAEAITKQAAPPDEARPNPISRAILALARDLGWPIEPQAAPSNDREAYRPAALETTRENRSARIQSAPAGARRL